MEKSEKIHIFLKEYDTLRAEILRRIGFRYAFLGISLGILGYFFFDIETLKVYQIAILVFIFVFLLGVYMQQGNLIKQCSKRIAEIEQEINEIAEEKILVWEHEKRGSKIFHKIYK